MTVNSAANPAEIAKGLVANARQRAVGAAASVEQAQRNLDVAQMHVGFAQRRAGRTFIASQRISSLLALLHLRFGARSGSDKIVANRFALPMFASWFWQLEINELSLAQRRRRAEDETRKSLPAVSPQIMRKILRMPPDALRFTNQMMGELTALSLDEWRTLRQGLVAVNFARPGTM